MPTFTYTALVDFSTRMFSALGTPHDLATLMATSLVGANLCGHDSHGVQQLPIYAPAVQNGGLLPAARATVSAPGAMLATLIVDAALGWGPPAAFLAADRLIERATSFGVAAAVIRRCHHIGRVGQYAEHFAAAGMIGITMCNSGAGGAPFGGRARMLGTNPIAIGVPRPGGQAPVMIDGSTTMVAGNKLKVLFDKGLPAPAGWLIDRAGNATTSPAEYLEGGSLLPLGGHKGYGLGVMVELLGGLLSGSSAAFLPDFGPGNGVLMIALRPDAFVPMPDYLVQVERVCAALKASPPREEGGEVLLPGEPEQRARLQRSTTGIALPDATWQLLQDLATSLGVAQPNPITS